MILDDTQVADELEKVHAEAVASDFELQVQKEVEDWIKQHFGGKVWANPSLVYEEFWDERLS